jgi:hypothetical protein
MTRYRLRRLRLLTAALALAATAVMAACSATPSSTSSTGKDRPSTTARLEIVRPTASETTGTDPTVEVNLVGATVVQATTGPLKPDEGHIHLFVDGQLVSMAYGTTQELHGLAPGTHSLQAEFVATDHAPFANRVVAGVIFEVKP